MRVTRWFEEVRDDVTFGIRQLVGSPALTLVAATTLALGIGANAAVFGVVKSVLLDALPYADADRLVRVYGGLRGSGSQRGPLSAGTVGEIGRRQQSFASLTSFSGLVVDVVFGDDAHPRVARSAWVDAAFFETLGVSVAQGRTFRPDEAGSGLAPMSGGRVGGGTTTRVVVLTHAAWQRLFSADPAVLGRDVRVDGIARRVIGVLPPDFVGPVGEADFYFAFDLQPVLADPLAARRSQWLGLVGRLKPGVTQGRAAQEVTTIWSDLVREYPGDNGSLGIAALPLRDAMVGETRTPLIVLMASAALVLLIACANLAATLLSRALARRKEFAVRVALGAGRRRLVRQLLTESMLLAALGGAAGLLLAMLALSAIRALALPLLPAYADLSLDRGAGLVTAILALCTGLVFGLAPALAAGHRDSQGALGDESRGSTESRRSQRLRGLLMAGQMALCVSLLAGTGLLARSLWAMAAQPLGFEPQGVLTAMVQLPSRTYPTLETRVRFHEQFVERLGALPGVEAVASATSIPTAVNSRAGLSVVGKAVPGEAQPFVLASFVSNDYFRTLRIPLREGRTFGREDRVGAPRTVVISDSLARQFWPEGGAVGARIRLGPDPNSAPIEVIGVVADVRNDSARQAAEPMVYGSIHQAAPPFVSVIVRATGDPLALVTPIEAVLTSLGGGLALQRPMTLAGVLGAGLAGRRVPVLLMGAFGALALILASVGVYAMFTSMTAAREREFGVRMALGSRPRAIAALVLWQGAGWMATGLAGGALGIAMAVRLVRGLLYGVAPFDPITLAISMGALVACATLALLVPLVRATRTDPAIALRAQ